uniref:Rx N-terminal domain-containing protein n=1 Tax=Aegilops tauschii subsp. strangulata TaxID=200361 RepID=A0A453A7Z3_AEGTS
GEEVSHSSSALSKLRPPKRLRASGAGGGSSDGEAVLLSGANNSIQEELQQLVDTLEDTMAGMKEFLFFLESYPRILRQPYGTYLILDNCMFGRQTELERVLNFLLRPNAMHDLAVLPIVGPIRVGKSTLIEYVCRDESVRDHFSTILFFPEGSLKNEGLIDPDAEDDERGAESGGRGAGGLPEQRGGDGGGGEGGGVGDGHGDGDGRVAEEPEEGRGGGEVGEERRRVLPREEQVGPPPDGAGAGGEGARERRSQTSAPRRISALVAPHTRPTATMLAASPPTAAMLRSLAGVRCGGSGGLDGGELSLCFSAFLAVTGSC